MPCNKPIGLFLTPALKSSALTETTEPVTFFAVRSVTYGNHVMLRGILKGNQIDLISQLILCKHTEST
ncbi:MAG: hypothetical protein H6543_03060 [Prevotellaceae bacterium]|nr:hypothetical protein [Prevotellaceae bacterium]